MKLTENEQITLKKLRKMKSHDKLIVEKKCEKDPTEFRVEVQSAEHFFR